MIDLTLILTMLNIAQKQVICVHPNKLLQTKVALARHTRAPSLSPQP